MSQIHRWCVAAAAWLLVAASAALLPGSARGAETVHLYLKANGADIKGESTQTSLGRENSIECVSFTQSATTAREAGSGMATGRRQYEPITIRKRVDKSSPLLMKALAQNQAVEGEFKFFRPNPAGDGTTEQFFTIAIKKGRVTSYKLFVPNTIDPASATEPPQEEVTFVFQTISWTYNSNGATFEDSTSQVREAEPLLQ